MTKSLRSNGGCFTSPLSEDVLVGNVEVTEVFGPDVFPKSEKGERAVRCYPLLLLKLKIIFS
jgi:hypothetical protein